MSRKHVLYRFFNGSDLLYVGITINPVGRFRQHRDDKPWWEDVTRIDMEPHPSREAVLAAEKAAIIAEHPRHNVTHNTGSVGIIGEAPSRVEHLQGFIVNVRDCVALGMADGSCPVGYVERVDDTWVTLILKNWITGSYCGKQKSYRLDDVREVAYAERISKDEVRDDHLADFQTHWHKRSA